MNKIITYVSAGTTGTSGIIHLYIFLMMIMYYTDIGIFFLAIGIIQLFWILPILKRWGQAWSYGGIGGTAILITIWSLTRMPNPITGRGLIVNQLSIIEETLQAIFIGSMIVSIIIARKENNQKIASR